MQRFTAAWSVGLVVLAFLLILIPGLGRVFLLQEPQEAKEISVSRMEVTPTSPAPSTSPTSPQFAAMIDGYFFAPQVSPLITDLFIRMKIINNTDRASVLGGYALSIYSDYFVLPNVAATEMPRDLANVVPPKTATNWGIGPESDLQKQTSTRLEIGDMAEGWIRFVLRGDPPTMICGKKTTFVVRFKDAWGNPSSAERTVDRLALWQSADSALLHCNP